MKKQYESAMRLLTETAENITQLKELFRSPNEDVLTEEERKNLQLALLNLTVAVKEFGK